MPFKYINKLTECVIKRYLHIASKFWNRTVSRCIISLKIKNKRKNKQDIYTVQTHSHRPPMFLHVKKKHIVPYQDNAITRGETRSCICYLTDQKLMLIIIIMIKQQFRRWWSLWWWVLRPFLPRAGCSFLSPWKVGYGDACSRAFPHEQCSLMDLLCTHHGSTWSSSCGMEFHSPSPS